MPHRLNDIQQRALRCTETSRGMMGIQKMRLNNFVAVRFLFTTACLAVPLLAQAVVIGNVDYPALDDDFIALFDTEEVSYSGGKYENETIRYRLYSPSNAASQPPGGWPLLVWFHGVGEAGSDNREHILWLDLPFANRAPDEGLPCYILAYQCPSGESWTSGAMEEQPLTICRAIVDNLVSTRPINPGRIVAAGVSSGGSACWHAVAKYPSLFAAAAPMGAGGYGGDYGGLAAATKHTPVWAFHTLRDPSAPIDSARNVVSRVQSLGGKAWLTECPGKLHGSWRVAFGDFHLIDWLLDQERGVESALPDYWTLSNWWKLEQQEGTIVGHIYGKGPVVACLVLLAFLARAKKKKACDDAPGKQPPQ